MRRFTDERGRDLADTIALYHRVTAQHRATTWAAEDAVVKTSECISAQVVDLVDLPPIINLAEALDTCQRQLLAQETIVFTTPEINWDTDVLSLQELVDVRRFLRAQEHFLANSKRSGELLLQTVTYLFVGIIEGIPELSADELGGFTVPLYTMIDDLPTMISRIIATLVDPKLVERGLFAEIQDTIHANVCAVTGVPIDDPLKKPPVMPEQAKLPVEQLVEAYLRNTPFVDLFMTPVPFLLPQATRFEHMHLVAGSGHGKTQTLQHLIIRDLWEVAHGRMSIVVIDSQSDLINTIANLDIFAPGNPLHDRLVHIDPTDLEWPVALNLFDVGRDRLDQYSLLDRERLTNSILELYDFVLGSLLDAGMTQKQTVIFRYITRLLLHIPGATIHTLRELLEDGGYDKYREHISKLGGSARAFFEQEFTGKEFSQTKRQVLRRLYGILENQTFERMFTHPKSKLDLFSEMNAGKVILINTAKDLLKESGTEIFGRFFIAMIAQAAAERATLPSGERMPTLVYVDEAGDYFDENIGIILSQARKYNIGMVLAHQYLGQLDGKLHEALAANTAIKFAGGVSAKDARSLANDLRTDASFIERQSKLSFAAYVKGLTPQAVSLSVEPGQMERLPRMKAGAREQLRAIMRERYATHSAELLGELAPQETAPKLMTQPPATAKPDDGEPMVWE